MSFSDDMSQWNTAAQKVGGRDSEKNIISKVAPKALSKASIKDFGPWYHGDNYNRIISEPLKLL